MFDLWNSNQITYICIALEQKVSDCFEKAGKRSVIEIFQAFKYSESWVSGWNQQFAKLSYGLNCTGGSNPPLSAKEKSLEIILGFFLWEEKSKWIQHN